VTDEPLRQLLTQYRTALDAQISLLHQLEDAAGRQHATTETRNFEQLAVESDHRDQLTRSLLAIEEGLAAVRETLAASRADIEPLDEFAAVMHLRRIAAELVARILATDRESMKVLSDAELARRAAMASLDRGETTLAAYRKVLTPPVASAALVNRRG
jgi:ATP:corrinoid adenosyltransferase